MRLHPEPHYQHVLQNPAPEVPSHLTLGVLHFFDSLHALSMLSLLDTGYRQSALCQVIILRKKLPEPNKAYSEPQIPFGIYSL